MPRRPLAILAALLTMGSGCSTTVDDRSSADDHNSSSDAAAPARFTIVPDDYHVPYAGTAEDGRKFFLSDELFDFGAKGQAGCRPAKQ